MSIECEPHHEVYATNGVDTGTGRRTSVVLCINDITDDSHERDAIALMTSAQAKSLALHLLEAADHVDEPGTGEGR